MSRQSSDDQNTIPPVCHVSGCANESDFWVYQPEQAQWESVCRRHLIELHPSLEVKAWLESNFAKPIELDRPSSPPDAPKTARATAFREIVETAMEW